MLVYTLVLAGWLTGWLVGWLAGCWIKIDSKTAIIAQISKLGAHSGLAHMSLYM